MKIIPFNSFTEQSGCVVDIYRRAACASQKLAAQEENEAEAKKRKSTTHAARCANVPKAKYLHWLHVFVCSFEPAISIACLVMG